MEKSSGPRETVKPYRNESIEPRRGGPWVPGSSTPSVWASILQEIDLAPFEPTNRSIVRDRMLTIGPSSRYKSRENLACWVEIVLGDLSIIVLGKLSRKSIATS